jgi:8-amino-7-oxononanoate synthase
MVQKSGMETALEDQRGAGTTPGASNTDYDHSNFYYSSSDDLFAIFGPFDDWWCGAARRAGYYLFSQPMSTPPGAHIDLEEQLSHKPVKLLNLASYNYLGLSTHPEVIAAAHAALDRYGLGAAGSPTLSGTMDVHLTLEKELAAFKNKEAAMVFPTGYSTNVGLLSALLRPGDWVLLDQYVHASIVDGAILAKAQVRFFRHNQPADLEKKLRGTSGKRLVVVEGVYSMDGDVARLPEIVEVAKRAGARIMLDEAHSGFVYGAEGRGVAEHFGLEDEVDIHVGTFSKALGGQGGFVAGPQSLYNYLFGFARSRVFSCALAPAVTAGVLQALRVAKREPQLRAALWSNVAYFRKLLSTAGVDVAESTSQIVPIMIRNDKRIFEISKKLQRAGLYLQPIIAPAVAKHRSRFRVSISATHSTADLDLAAAILVETLREEGIL